MAVNLTPKRSKIDKYDKLQKPAHQRFASVIQTKPIIPLIDHFHDETEGGKLDSDEITSESEAATFGGDDNLKFK